MLDVEGEPNALELLVDKPMKDNSTISVKFQDKQNTSSVINSSNTVYCKLTDGYQPSALKVNVVDNHTLEVEFSEAVLRKQDAASQGNAANENYSADIPENYAIDTLGLKSYWGVENDKTEDENTSDSSNSKISEKNFERNEPNSNGTVKVGKYRNAVDKRHIVTIKLGEGKYLQPGKHSLAISNVGDWAAATDGWRNIINTATVDFEVPADTAKPNFELKVQSPEQFKLTANCDFELVNKDSTFRVEKSDEEPKDVVELQQFRDGAWVTISNHEAGIGYNPIMVSQINDLQSNDLTREYLVETRSDWTRVCDTKNTYSHYYRNQYRLRIAANSIRNLSNGLTNEEIILNLDDPIMKSLDGASPVIDKIEQAPDANGNLTSNYDVTFSEPVKMNDEANKETTTPTQDTNEVSPYTAYFVKRDASQKSVQAEVGTKHFINAEDTIIRVNPVAPLDAGEWDLYVRGASDDVGNTAATLSGVITVEAQTVSTNFRVVWAAVSKTDKYSGITAGEGNYIFVKFNKPISYAGGSANVGSTLNYTLNGRPLPTGSHIRAHIQEYDHNVDRIDSITIVLPSATQGGLGSSTMDYAVNGQNAVLTISDAVTSTEGDKLTTVSGYNLPYQYGAANQTLADGTKYTALTTRGDAVWGNDPAEQWAEITSGATDKQKAYDDAVKNALKDDKYRKIILDYPETGKEAGREKLKAGIKWDGAEIADQYGINTGLDISRIVDIDLNGNIVKGNVTISSTEAADYVKILNDNATRTEAYILGNKDNKEKDVTLLINTPNSGVAIHDKINVAKNGESKNAMKVNGVTSNTLENQATYFGNVLLAAGNIGFKNLTNSSFIVGDNNKVVVDTTGTVYMRGLYNGENADMEKAGNLVLEDISATSSLNITAKAPATKITIKDSAELGENLTIISRAEKVEVLQNPKDKMATLKADGGTFVQKAVNGKELDDDQKVDVGETGAQEWFADLTVINGAVKGGTGVELVTVGAISGSSLATFNGGDDIKDFITGKAGEKEAVEGVKYTVESVVPSVSSDYIGYDTSKHTLYVKSAANSLKYKVTETFTVAIKVKNSATSEVQTLTRTVKVVIDPDQK